jgi:hypothetical protein
VSAKGHRKINPQNQTGAVSSKTAEKVGTFAFPAVFASEGPVHDDAQGNRTGRLKKLPPFHQKPIQV